MKIPTSEHFRKNVDEIEENYGIVDCVYIQCIEEFSRLKLNEVSKLHETRIIRAFLFDWGKMQRWLGDKGVEEVSRKIKEKSFVERIEPLRDKSLKLENLDKMKSLIIKLFDEISGTSFRTKNHKIKHVNSTAASKILHLCCPDFFIMWDADIRRGYKEGNGECYFQFLTDMKKFWEALEKTIKELQKKYGKRVTRIIDEYNWKESH